MLNFFKNFLFFFISFILTVLIYNVITLILIPKWFDNKPLMKNNTKPINIIIVTSDLKDKKEVAITTNKKYAINNNDEYIIELNKKYNDLINKINLLLEEKRNKNNSK